MAGDWTDGVLVAGVGGVFRLTFFLCVDHRPCIDLFKALGPYLAVRKKGQTDVYLKRTETVSIAARVDAFTVGLQCLKQELSTLEAMSVGLI